MSVCPICHAPGDEPSADCAACAGSGPVWRRPHAAIAQAASVSRPFAIGLGITLLGLGMALLGMCLLAVYGPKDLGWPFFICEVLGILLADITVAFAFVGPVLLVIALFRQPRLKLAAIGLAMTGWGSFCLYAVGRATEQHR